MATEFEKTKSKLCDNVSDVALWSDDAVALVM